MFVSKQNDALCCSVLVCLRHPAVGSADLHRRLTALPLVFFGVSGSRQTGGQRRAEQVGNARRRQSVCRRAGRVRGSRRPGGEETAEVAQPSGSRRVAGRRLDVVSTACRRRLTQSGVDERQRRTDDVLAESRRAGTGGVQFLLTPPLRSPVLKPDLDKQFVLSR